MKASWPSDPFAWPNITPFFPLFSIEIDARALWLLGRDKHYQLNYISSHPFLHYPLLLYGFFCCCCWFLFFFFDFETEPTYLPRLALNSIFRPGRQWTTFLLPVTRLHTRPPNFSWLQLLQQAPKFRCILQITMIIIRSSLDVKVCGRFYMDKVFPLR